jgi:hypothetical protein
MSDEEVTTGQAVATRADGPALDSIETWMSEKGYGVFKVLDDGRRILELHDELKRSCILAAPATNLVQIDRNWTPQLRPMRVNVNDPQSAFKVGSVKVNGQFEDMMDLAAPAWQQLGGLCGISRAKVKTVRWPNGKGLDVHVTAKMRQPDGNWLMTTASSDYDYDVEAELLEIDKMERWEKFEASKSNGKPRPTPADIRKEVLRARQFAARTAETKAYSRCVKALTGLRTFRKSELIAKPLMAVTWLMTPDMNDPGSREYVRMQLADASADLYGSEDSESLGTEMTFGGGEEIPGTFQVMEDRPELEAGSGPDQEQESEIIEAQPAAAPAPAPAEAAAAPAAEPAPAAAQPTPAAEPKVEPGGQVQANILAATPRSEEWDMDEGPTAAAAADKPPKPTAPFTPKNGPFAGKDVSEIITTPEGRMWLVAAHEKLTTAPKKQMVLDWLSYALGRVVTAETLDSVA